MFDGFCKLRRAHAYNVSVNYSCAVKMASCHKNTHHNLLDLRLSKIMFVNNKLLQISALVVHYDVQIFKVISGFGQNDLVDFHDLAHFSVSHTLTHG